jgi:hypothetical protein
VLVEEMIGGDIRKSSSARAGLASPQVISASAARRGD